MGGFVYASCSRCLGVKLEFACSPDLQIRKLRGLALRKRRPSSFNRSRNNDRCFVVSRKQLLAVR